MPFVKIWTTVKQDAWYLSLKNSQRGIWFQCLIEAKDGEKSGEIGTFFASSYSSLAQTFGCDDTTARKILTKFADDCKLTIKTNEFGTLTIHILNFQYWQGLSRDRDNIKTDKNRRKIGEKSAKNPPELIENEIENESEIQKTPPDKKPEPPKPKTDQYSGPKLSDMGIMLRAIGHMARLSNKLQTDLAVNCGNLRQRLEDWSEPGGYTWTMFQIGRYYELFFTKATNGTDPLEDIRLPMNYLYTLIHPDREAGQQPEMESPSGVAYKGHYTVEHWAKKFMPEALK
jgi:hypothetical protein